VLHIAAANRDGAGVWLFAFRFSPEATAFHTGGRQGGFVLLLLLAVTTSGCRCLARLDDMLVDGTGIIERMPLLSLLVAINWGTAGKKEDAVVKIFLWLLQLLFPASIMHPSLQLPIRSPLLTPSSTVLFFLAPSSSPPPIETSENLDLAYCSAPAYERHLRTMIGCDHSYRSPVCLQFFCSSCTPFLGLGF